MNIVRHIRPWLWSIVLALPAILFPGHRLFSLGNHHYLGWPYECVDLQTAGFSDFGGVRFDFSPLEFAENSLLWIVVAWLLWNVRRWARKRPDWYGAFLQALLVSGYSLLLFFFASEAVSTAWDIYLSPMDASTLLKAFQFADRYLVALYVFDFMMVGVLLFCDALTRQPIQRFLHLITALGLAGVLLYMLPSRIQTQQEFLHNSVEFVKKDMLRAH